MKIKKINLWLGTSTVLLVASTLLAQASGGILGNLQPSYFAQVIAAEGHDHSAHGTDNTTPNSVASEHGALSKDAQTVLDNYIKIHNALAQDSLRGVTESAAAAAKAIQADPAKTFPAAATSQTELLAKTRDLKTARDAFKRLSNLLIESLDKQNKPPGQYVKAYCPMADASWLQAGHAIQNPYFGKSMLRCGSIVQGKGSAKSDHSGHH